MTPYSCRLSVLLLSLVLVHSTAAEASKASKAPPEEEDAGMRGAELGELVEGLGLSMPEVTAGSLMRNQEHVRGAFCGFHAAQAAQYLAKAGVQMALAVRACVPEKTSVKGVQGAAGFVKLIKSPCVADIAAVIGSLSLVASYLSMVASQCSDHSDLSAMCAAMIEHLIASLAQVSSAGAVASTSCGGAPMKQVAPIRRLGSQKLEMTMCALDAVHIATSLGVLSLAADQMFVACKLHQGYTNDIPVLSGITENYCVVEVGYVLYSILSAAAYIAATMSHCSKGVGLKMGSMCAASISQIAASVAGTPLIGAGINLECEGTKDSLHKTEGLQDIITGMSTLGRRLLLEQGGGHGDNSTKAIAWPAVEAEAALARGLKAMQLFEEPSNKTVATPPFLI